MTGTDIGTAGTGEGTGTDVGRGDGIGPGASAGAGVGAVSGADAGADAEGAGAASRTGAASGTVTGAARRTGAVTGTGTAPGTRPAGLSDAKRALLAQRLRGRARPRQAVPRRPADTVPPLSFAQERLWFMEQFAPGTAAYNIPVARRLHGPLDGPALQRSLDAVLARHETLRSRYPVTDDGRPVLEIADPAPFLLRTAEAESEEQAARLVDELAALPFDLVNGPLVNGLLVRLADDDHVLLLVVHHSVSDGWSSEVLVSEVLRGYAAYARGEPDPLPELAVQYGDFALWQRDRLSGDRLAAEVAYWAGELAGVRPLELPGPRPRPERQTFVGAGYGFDVDRRLLDQLTELGREHGATVHMVMLAAFQLVLSRFSGQRDFAVGSPVAGRPEPELEGLVGMFVNVLALRARLDGDPTFTELLARIRETCLEAYAHQELPFAQLVSELNVERDVSRSPVFQAVLAIQNYAMEGAPSPEQSGEQGLTIEPFGLHAAGTRFDAELFLMEWPDGLRGAFNYNTDLFDEADIARIADQLGRLLHAVAERPDVPVSTLDTLDPAERDRLLVEWNDTSVEVPADATLPGLIAAQTTRTPDAVAVDFEGTTLTYAELDRAAERVAGRLRAEGVGPGALVAVSADRSPELVAGLLGVLKSGAGYTPLDPEYPAERLAFMLSDSAAGVLLTQGHLPVPAGCEARVLLLDDAVSAKGAEGADAPGDPTGAGPGPAADDIAYMIYTSGSTGRPKGVPNTHRAIVNRLLWMQRAYRLGPDDAVLQKTPTGFDVSVWELFWPLLTGARLVMAKPGGHKDAAHLRDTIAERGVTVTHFVPSMLDVFLAEDDIERCSGLRRVLCSGEELPPHTAREFTARLPHCALANLYGPTEAAVDVTSWECVGPLDTVPIGMPVDNTRLYVLDADLRPAPVGTPGELHIGGTQVALGYHRRPGLTAARFVPDPYGPPGSRLYRTGDLARRRADGRLEHLGRIDQQVKMRGLRIEPGEIEAALRAEPSIAAAAVVVREDNPGDKRLVAYLVTRPEGERAEGEHAGEDRPVEGEHAGPDPAELRTALRRTLPDYMVPTAFVVLDALPLTPNGKLDRRALPAPQARRAIGGALAAPGTDTERVLADIWAEVLKLPEVGIDDDFFDLGGHSLLATQVVARARKRLPDVGARPVSVMDLFTCRTVRALSALADLDESERGPSRLLHRLTRPVPESERTLSLVCVPFGGGSAVVYQPLADELPAGYDLWSVAIPGHDIGVTERHLPFEELAESIAAEVRERVGGPVVLYGHCGVGSALAIAVSRLLEASGRELEAVYIGAQFPFARPRSKLLGALSRISALEPLLGDRVYVNWLRSMGAEVGELDETQTRFIIGNMRRDSKAAEEYFTTVLAEVEAGGPRLRAPVVSVIGNRDPATDFYEERYLEWRMLAERSALAVLDEGGHFFLKYRAKELSEIVTRTHPAVLAGTTATDLPPQADDGPWWFHGVSDEEPREAVAEEEDTTVAGDPAGGDGRDDGGGGDDGDGGTGTATATEADSGSGGGKPGRRRSAGVTGAAAGVGRGSAASGPPPGMGRFLVVAFGQLLSITGSALTEFALPVWIYMETGSMGKYALYAVIGMLPGILVGPLAGAIVDRLDRRRVMLISDLVAGGTQAALLSLLLSGNLASWHIYTLLAVLSVALTFQRLAYASSVPQLVPKQYLGHANGIVQMAFGVSQFVVPLAAVALMAAVGLRGVLILDVASYAIAIGVLAFVKFPKTLPWKRRESLVTEIRHGFSYSWRNRGFRAMLLWFAALNIFLSPLFLLITPLVLSFDTLAAVARVAVAGGAGAIIGGIAMGFWGGPKRHRLRGMLGLAGALAATSALVGVHANLWVIGAGAFGMSCALSMVNGVYTTIVQVKVPQRFHGRVFALNTLVAWSTLPIGHGIIAPAGSALFGPMLDEGGPLASTVGAVIGTGPGRGIGFMYLLFGAAMLVLVVVGLRLPVLAKFDENVPDALPDDLVGIQERERRIAEAGAGAGAGSGSGSGSGSGTGSGAGARPGVGSGTGTGTGVKPLVAVGAGPGARTRAGAGADPGPGGAVDTGEGDGA
ncbi:amino acid adenylation domain-containing protein [Streptomyces sp. AM 4-1-1]|uniref:non-ribosomal peptide synthetase/MFS transporter n=1 Tax=Streptomyces sp. AM 4-1-1 TaxID=3028710 RepID=UPI0023B90989|nr:non-ribosomal peptide synthetase/MFS transporter [Streptomyces sp. AM 4-1-1]WEH34008.1 amino acid adenylation domain-containing protein [Streptomyces sp. AM 4-1-1]